MFTLKKNVALEQECEGFKIQITRTNYKIKKKEDAEGGCVIRKKIEVYRYFYSKLQSMYSIQDIWAQEVSSMTTQFPETVQEVPRAT